MSWKFEFEAPVGTRILSGQFFGVCHWNPSNRDIDLWWGEDEGRWAPFDELHNMDTCCTHAPVRSFKAFKRHLRKHPELKAAEEVVLVSKFVGHNIKARWVEE